MTNNEQQELFLDSASIGQSFVIDSICDESAIKKRLCDIGIVRGTVITRLFNSPLGDPAAYLVRNTVIALRNRDAGHIKVLPIET